MPYLVKETTITFLIKGNFETKNAMIIGSIIKQQLKVVNFFLKTMELFKSNADET